MMRRGMILKLKNDYALIATDDSDFVRVKLKEGMRVGQKIFILHDDIISSQEEYKRRLNMPNYLKVISALAACIAIIVIINNSFINDTGSLYAVVSIDINPSFELGIDESLNVVELRAMNKESEGVLDIKLIGEPLSVVVSEILSGVEEAGYVLASDNAVLVSMVSFENDDEEPLQKFVADGIRLAMAENEVYESSKIIFIQADEEDLEAAGEQKLSVGKYLLLEMSDNKIDKARITEGKVSDLINEEEIKDDLESDENIQIIEGEDLQKLNQIEEVFDDIETMKNRFTNKDSGLKEYEDTYEKDDSVEDEDTYEEELLKEEAGEDIDEEDEADYEEDDSVEDEDTYEEELLKEEDEDIDEEDEVDYEEDNSVEDEDTYEEELLKEESGENIDEEDEVDYEEDDSVEDEDTYEEELLKEEEDEDIDEEDDSMEAEDDDGEAGEDEEIDDSNEDDEIDE